MYTYFFFFDSVDAWVQVAGRKLYICIHLKVISSKILGTRE